MKRHEASDLLAAMAIDAVSDDERRNLDAFMVIDPDLRAEYDEFQALAAALATAIDPDPPPPPPAVWAGIHDRIEGRDTAVPGLAPVQPRPDGAGRTARVRPHNRRWWHPERFGRLLAVAAAVTVFGIGAAFGMNLVDTERYDLAALATASRNQPGSDVVTLTGQAGFEDVSVDIVLGGDGTGYILAGDLPAVAEDRTYQLWLIVPDGRDEADPLVISASVLGSEPGLAAFTARSDVVGFALTEEPAGGVEASEGATVALWLADS